MKIINIRDQETITYSTEARAQGKNERLKTKYKDLNLICERPNFFPKKFEIDLLASPFDLDGKIIYGKDVEIYLDQKGRWWCPEELSSEYLANFFIKNPINYFRIMSKRVQDTKKVINVLKQINEKIDSLNDTDLIDNLKKLKECYCVFYSYYSSTYIVYDELVLRFRRLLKRFLPVKEANIYFCEFLQAEMTKEAIKYKAVGENTAKNRMPTTAKDEPIIFYKEPKFFHRSNFDNGVLEKLQASDLTKELKEEFVALRLIVPLAIQISEEAQYIECKMLWSITRILLDNINTFLVDKRVIKPDIDVGEYSINEIKNMLQNLQTKQYFKKVLQGLGVSKGRVQGRVKIIKDLEDHSKFQEGDILVTKITDPSMVMLIGKAAGVICDFGGLTSHPSIVSREMGIPGIVSAVCEKTSKKATEILKDEMIVNMCGESGAVHLTGED